MRCPHCTVVFHDSWKEIHIDSTKEFYWYVSDTICPNCNNIIFKLGRLPILGGTKEEFITYPRTTGRTPLAPLIDKKFADDYNEACLVLADSPKACAALSRRCLQNLLREKAGVKHGDLSDEIQQVIDSGKLPSHLAESIDAVRNIGNFASHPIKSKHSGEIADVEAGEAAWLLDTLEGLFDFYFVQPAITKQKRDALNKKLGDAGKPSMK